MKVKRILSCLVCLAMLCSLLPAAVLAAEIVNNVDGLVIEGTTVTKYTGTATEITIPDGVTAIGPQAFQRNETLTCVILPESVTALDTDAFRSAGKLSSITMPGVTSIGKQALSDTALTDISLPAVTEIGERAFYGTSFLQSISMPKVEHIGTEAFLSTGFTEFTVPDSVTKVDDNILWAVGLKKLNISLNTLLNADFSQRAFVNAFINSPDAEMVLTAVRQNVTLIENGVQSGDKTVSFDEGSKYSPGFCVTSVIADSGEITNQTGRDIKVNGETVANNSLKPVGDVVSDAYLSSLSLSDTYLVPDFGNLENNYTADVTYMVESVDVTAVPSNKNAAVAVNGTAITAENVYQITVPLVEGENIITILVTAPDNTQKTYTITLTKKPQPINIEIGTAQELLDFAAKVNNGDYTDVREVTAELTGNIDMSGVADWMPIGTLDGSAYFSGVFDGKGYTIQNLTINKSGSGYYGLFAATDGTIQNLNVSGSLINENRDSGSSVGVIAGLVSGGMVINCNTNDFTIKSDVQLGICVGGIVGQANGAVIENCVSETAINITPLYYAGGIAGATVDTKIIRCTNNGNSEFTGSTYLDFGGITGSAQKNSEISYCTNNGTISSSRDSWRNTCIGGIASRTLSGSFVHHCTNTGGMTGSASYFGGIVGQVAPDKQSDPDFKAVSNCINRGKISATNGSVAGGIAASVQNHAIDHCVSLGEISAESAAIKYHPITASISRPSEQIFGNNYYDKNITSQGSAVTDETSGAAALGADEINTPEFVKTINDAGGDFRFDQNSMTTEVNKENPAYTVPENLTAYYGDTLADVALPDGWTWADDTQSVGSLGNHAFKAIFTPDNTEHYNIITDIDVPVTVSKANPVIAEAPKAARIRKGYELSESAISGGVVKGVSDTVLEGTFAWKDGTEVMNETGEFTKTAVFTPADENYAPVEADISVTVYRPSSGGGTTTTRYTVTFDTQGGSKISSLSVTRNNVVKEPAEPTKEGYTFGGWFTSKECTEEYDFASKVTKNITLYAKWTEDGKEPTEPDEWKNPFTDVDEGDWFYDAVQYVNENGLFSGVTETMFAPSEAITRGMLVTVLWRMEDKPVVNYLMTFDDVSENAYYAEAVRWAASNGIVKGYSDTEFAPDKLISREEIAAIMQRYATFKGIDTTEKVDLSKFTDHAAVSEWAKANVEWAVGYGLISGKDGNILEPQGNTTRAEAAAILQRFLEKTMK